MLAQPLWAGSEDVVVILQATEIFSLAAGIENRDWVNKVHFSFQLYLHCWDFQLSEFVRELSTAGYATLICSFLVSQLDF